MKADDDTERVQPWSTVKAMIDSYTEKGEVQFPTILILLKHSKSFIRCKSLGEAVYITWPRLRQRFCARYCGKL